MFQIKTKMHQECTKVAKVTVKATIQIHEYFRKMAPSDELLSEYLRQQQLCEEEKEELEEMSWEDKPLHGTYHRPVMANQTEIVVVDKHQKRAVVIDITFPSGSDIQTNERERLEKYQGLKEELEKMWRVKATLGIVREEEHNFYSSFPAH